MWGGIGAGGLCRGCRAGAAARQGGQCGCVPSRSKDAGTGAAGSMAELDQERRGEVFNCKRGC